MTEQDPETGFFLSEKEDAAETPVKSEALNPEQCVQAAPETAETKPIRPPLLDTAPSINKKLIMMIICGVIAVCVLMSVFTRHRRRQAASEKNKTAQINHIPNFGDYKSRAYTGEAPVSDDIPETETMPYYTEPPSFQTGSPSPPAAQTASRQDPGNDSLTKAMASAMLPDIQGRRLGAYQNAPQPGSQTSNEHGYLNPEAYYAQRFEALSPYMTETGAGNAVPNAAGYGASQYQTQNMQDTKQAFYSDSLYPDPGNAALSGAFLEDDTIWNGTIIPGVLITGINTDLPGDVMARVTENVYDSKSGKKLLVPQGSILIAKYNSSVSFAQERVQIAWTTLIRPDGYQVGLGNMNGVDNQGFSGIHGSVDNHFWQYVKAAGIISAFTILNGEINYSRTAQENQSIQNLIAANQAVMNQLSAEIINRVLNIQPTITVKNGTKINIFCNTAIRLPPVPDYPAAGVYTR